MHQVHHDIVYQVRHLSASTKRLRLCFAYMCMQASHASLHRMLLCIARLSARPASRLCSAGCCSVTLASPPCMSPSPHALGLVSSPFCMALLAFAELSCFAPLVLPCIVFSQCAFSFACHAPRVLCHFAKCLLLCLLSAKHVSHLVMALLASCWTTLFLPPLVLPCLIFCQCVLSFASHAPRVLCRFDQCNVFGANSVQCHLQWFQHCFMSYLFIV